MFYFNQNGSPFVKIVYSKIKTNGKVELVPLRLYADVSVEHTSSSPLLMTAESETLAKTLIGNRYLLQKVLGQGGFGRTYLASDTHRFNELCVLKEFLPSRIGEYEVNKSRDLFEKEAKILHQINHPQIPKFLASFEENGRLFLVQEYVNGKTYSTLLRERQQQGQGFSEAEVTNWLRNLLSVLDYIHGHHIIHRDISPDNVMLPHGKDLPVLIDFGVGKQTTPLHASSMGSSSSSNSGQGLYRENASFVGKIGYAPCEQISLGQCSPSSDLYALGVTAIVLLTGKEPNLLMDQYSLEWQWRAFVSVSDHLAQVLDKMLATKPKNRYRSAKDVLADLQPPLPPSVTGLKPLVPNSEPELQETTLLAPPSAGITVVSQLPVTVASESKQQTMIDATFVERCQEELAHYVGPIASFLVKDTLAQNPEVPPQKLIEALAALISNRQQALEFQQHVLSWLY